MKVIYSNWVLKSKYFQIEQWNMFQNILEYNKKTFTIVDCFYLKFLSSSSERNHSMPHHDCDISIWHPFGTDWACAEKSKCLFWSNTPWPRASPRVPKNTNTNTTNTKNTNTNTNVFHLFWSKIAWPHAALPPVPLTPPFP